MAPPVAQAVTPADSRPGAPRPGPPGPVRHRRQPVRRPRRLDQHHAADPAGPGRRGRSTSATTARSTRSCGPPCRRTCRASPSARTRAATSSTSATWSTGCASRGPARRQGLRRRRRRDRRPTRSPSCRPTASPASSRPHDGQRLGLAGDGQHDHRRACDVDLAADRSARRGRRALARPATGRGALARAITALEAGALPDAELADLRRRGGRAAGPGARHHRHRRLGQVVAHRRAGPPLPPRPRGQAAHRRARRRPHPAAGRRGAARRPHPHERHRRGPTSSSARSPPAAPAARCPSAVDDIVAACKAAGARPGDRRDARHRPGRRRHRRPLSTCRST